VGEETIANHHKRYGLEYRCCLKTGIQRHGSCERCSARGEVSEMELVLAVGGFEEQAISTWDLWY
jgi:hypothetical protein